jgi:hypothetical protein
VARASGLTMTGKLPADNAPKGEIVTKLNSDTAPTSGKGSDSDRFSMSPQSIRHGGADVFDLGEGEVSRRMSAPSRPTRTRSRWESSRDPGTRPTDGRQRSTSPHPDQRRGQLPPRDIDQQRRNADGGRCDDRRPGDDAARRDLGQRPVDARRRRPRLVVRRTQ